MLSLFSIGRDTLQARVDQLSGWVNWATATVGAGVTLEAIEPLHDFIAWTKFRRRESTHIKEIAEFVPVQRSKSKYKSPSHPLWLKWCGRIGLIAVVAGVVGEWRCGAKLEDAQNAVHEYDVAKLMEADQKAGAAATSAKTAHDEADAAGITAGKAQRKAGVAKETAGKAETTADAASKVSVDVKAEAASLKKQLEDSSAEAKALENSLFPRKLATLQFDDGSSNLDVLQPIVGTEFIIESIPDFEARTAAGSIQDVLGRANFKIIKSEVTEQFAWEGVTVDIYMPPTPGVGDWQILDSMSAGERVRAFLWANGWAGVHAGYSERGEFPNPNVLRIRVGFKPNPFFDIPFPGFPNREKDEAEKYSKLAEPIADIEKRKKIVLVIVGNTQFPRPSF